jgi:1,2-phenylacetyl-CoA epoxidase catalytic subunit
MSEQEFEQRVKRNEELRKEFEQEMTAKVYAAVVEIRKNPSSLMALASKLAWDGFLMGKGDK